MHSCKQCIKQTNTHTCNPAYAHTPLQTTDKANKRVQTHTHINTCMCNTCGHKTCFAQNQSTYVRVQVHTDMQFSQQTTKQTHTRHNNKHSHLRGMCIRANSSFRKQKHINTNAHRHVHTCCVIHLDTKHVAARPQHANVHVHVHTNTHVVQHVDTKHIAARKQRTDVHVHVHTNTHLANKQANTHATHTFACAKLRAA